MEPSTSSVEFLYQEHRRAIWGLCYRMTGSVQDAEEITQDTFVRALERPPTRTEEPWRPWLMKVALNASRDHLRRRRRRAYPGHWLPEPVVLEDSGAWRERLGVSATSEDPSARYSLLESASFAFLVALEVLTPQQRAVLLMRDVFDRSGREVAQWLSMTEGNVKVTLHRARKRLASTHQDRVSWDHAHEGRTMEALQALVQKLMMQDYDGLYELLREDVRLEPDAGGVYAFARRPILGSRRVVAFLRGLLRVSDRPFDVAMKTCNGLPCLVLRWPEPLPRLAPLILFWLDIDAEGNIVALYNLGAPGKLSALSSEAGSMV